MHYCLCVIRSRPHQYDDDHHDDGKDRRGGRLSRDDSSRMSRDAGAQRGGSRDVQTDSSRPTPHDSADDDVTNARSHRKYDVTGRRPEVDDGVKESWGDWAAQSSGRGWDDDDESERRHYRSSDRQREDRERRRPLHDDDDVEPPPVTSSRTKGDNIKRNFDR